MDKSNESISLEDFNRKLEWFIRKLDNIMNDSTLDTADMSIFERVKKCVKEFNLLCIDFKLYIVRTRYKQDLLKQDSLEIDFIIQNKHSKDYCKTCAVVSIGSKTAYGEFYAILSDDRLADNDSSDLLIDEDDPYSIESIGKLTIKQFLRLEKNLNTFRHMIIHGGNND